MPYRPHELHRSGPPTVTDPALVTARDRKMFLCWVETIGDGPRWVFVSFDRTRYTGPIYAGQDSLESIGALVDDWWETKKSLGQAGGTAKKLRDWLNNGR